MNPQGDQSGWTAERIRLTPRLVRPAAEPEEDELAGPAGPEEEEEVEIDDQTGESPLRIRPDRSRMDPLSLDRSACRKFESLFQYEQESERQKILAKSDGFLLRAALGFLGFLMAAGLWWMLGRRAPGELSVTAGHTSSRPGPGQGPIPPVVTEPALVLLEGFLAAPDADAKAAFVLDPERVKPLMETVYAKGPLPDSSLKAGAPQRQAHGITMVPAKVGNGWMILIFCREKEGRLLLDWETYYQEVSQKLAQFFKFPGSPGGVFRVVLERTHSFEAGFGAVCVRLAAPGHPASTEAVIVAEEARPSLTGELPWNERRRALDAWSNFLVSKTQSSRAGNVVRLEL